MDEHFAVNVKFQDSIDPDADSSSTFILGIDEFSHYFAEDELIRMVEENTVEPDGKTLPFDGMSCKAFKLDQLKMGKQVQRIAGYEAAQSKDDS